MKAGENLYKDSWMGIFRMSLESSMFGFMAAKDRKIILIRHTKDEGP